MAQVIHITIHVTVVRCPPRPANVNHPAALINAAGAVMPGHYTVTLCADSPYVFKIGGPQVDVRNIVNSHPPGNPPPPAISTGHEHGNGINIIPGGKAGANTIDADIIL